VKAHQLKGQISHLCTVGKVSRIGYYAWLTSESAHQIKEESDEQEVRLIKEIFVTKRKKQGFFRLK
jgi:hypothetical protein